MPISKLPYLIMSLLVFTTPMFKFKKHRWLKSAAIIALFISLTVGWNYLVRETTEYTSRTAYCCTTSIRANSQEQVKFILQNPITFSASLADFFINWGFFNHGRIVMPQEADNYKFSSDTLITYYIMMIIVALYVSSDFKKRNNLKKITHLWLLAIIITVFGIITALYVAANSVGQFKIWGVQTRYFYPLIVFGLTWMAAQSPFEFTAKKSKIIHLILSIIIIINVIFAIQIYSMPKIYTVNQRIVENNLSPRLNRMWYN